MNSSSACSRAEVPDVNRTGLDESLVSLVAPHSFAAEQYRTRRMLTEQMHKHADSRLIAKWVEGFLLVVAAHRTPRRLVEEALNALSPAQVIGLVFNNDDRPFFGYYGSYGSYSAYGEASNGHRPRWWKRGSKAPS